MTPQTEAPKMLMLIARFETHSLSFSYYSSITTILQLKLFSVIQAFRAGRFPSNAQIFDTLRYVNSRLSDENASSTLSSEGLKLVRDIRSIIKVSAEIVEDKNADELLQNFVWHTQGTDINRLREAAGESASDSGAAAPLGTEGDGKPLYLSPLSCP